MSEREKEIARIASMYTKYLNGPLGDGVMNHLQEGESFTINRFIEIHKERGKAVVRILDSSEDESDSLQKV
jgi:hypothetical protein